MADVLIRGLSDAAVARIDADAASQGCRAMNTFAADLSLNDPPVRTANSPSRISVGLPRPPRILTMDR